MITFGPGVMIFNSIFFINLMDFMAYGDLSLLEKCCLVRYRVDVSGDSPVFWVVVALVLLPFLFLSSDTDVPTLPESTNLFTKSLIFFRVGALSTPYLRLYAHWVLTNDDLFWKYNFTISVLCFGVYCSMVNNRLVWRF